MDVIIASDTDYDRVHTMFLIIFMSLAALANIWLFFVLLGAGSTDLKMYLLFASMTVMCVLNAGRTIGERRRKKQQTIA